MWELASNGDVNAVDDVAATLPTVLSLSSRLRGKESQIASLATASTRLKTPISTIIAEIPSGNTVVGAVKKTLGFIKRLFSKAMRSLPQLKFLSKPLDWLYDEVSALFPSIYLLGPAYPDVPRVDGVLSDARKTRDDDLARFQWHLQRLWFEVQMGVAQRCRGWTPQT